MLGKKTPLGKHSARSIEKAKEAAAAAVEDERKDSSASSTSAASTNAKVPGAAAIADKAAVPIAAQPASPVAPITVPGASPTPRTSGYSGINAESAAVLEMRGKKRARKTALIATSVIVGVLLVVYLGGIALFSNVFYPNTRMGTADISMKTAADAGKIVSKIADTYAVNVIGDGLNFTVDSQQVGVMINGSSSADKALADNQAWMWPYEVFQSHDETKHLEPKFNAERLRTAVATTIDAFNQTATDPTNATVAYSKDSASFSIIKEAVGTKVDAEATIKVIGDAITKMETEAVLGVEQLVKPTVLSTDPGLVVARDTANGYLAADFELVLGSTGIHASQIGPAEVQQWVTINPDMTVAFNEEAMEGWMTDLANSIDTVGTERSFVGADGETYTVGGGTYGWKVDIGAFIEEAKAAIAEGQTWPLNIPCTSEGYTWAGKGVPDWGAHAEVDISDQHVWFFSAEGELLWESDCVSGKKNHDTRVGLWRILFKKSPAILTGDIDPATGEPEYRTPVTYWMPFTSFGQGFHDATWRSNFGGSIYVNSGSHGCVNLPYSAAEELYGIISEGNAVIIHE